MPASDKQQGTQNDAARGYFPYAYTRELLELLLADVELGADAKRNQFMSTKRRL